MKITFINRDSEITFFFLNNATKPLCVNFALRNTVANILAHDRPDEPLKVAILKIVDHKNYVGLPCVVEDLRDKRGFKDNHKRIARVSRARPSSAQT